MTTTDRAKANEEVARAMGWHVVLHKTKRVDLGYEYTFEDEPWWVSPTGQKFLQPPDLYADTPEGAKAREDAEEWLLSKHIEFQVWNPPQAIRVGCWHRTFGNISGCGVTLAEARAEAIVAAVRAMQGGE